jgi:hypothetical protein
MALLHIVNINSIGQLLKAIFDLIVVAATSDALVFLKEQDPIENEFVTGSFG